ncbi:MAG: hypothetical protein ACI8QC_003182 [Planctomycetota bacterium]|jgi:hypothetical protein
MSKSKAQAQANQSHKVGLEERVRALGAQLGLTLAAAIEGLNAADEGPLSLGKRLGLETPLASRLLRAAAQENPFGVLHHSPGPAPLRRFQRAAARRGSLASDKVKGLERAIVQFERLLKDDLGDLTALSQLLSAWLPEARAEFELRRKQSAFRAMSELRGASAELDLSACFMHPSANGTHLDVAWAVGSLGLKRLRPGINVRFSSQRVTGSDDPERQPSSLDGAPIAEGDRSTLNPFCQRPPGVFRVNQVGELLQYTLDSEGYGSGSEVDLLFGEFNPAEIEHPLPKGASRRGWAYSDVAVPARSLVFDMFLHEDVYPGMDPELLLYDTAIHGIADVNDESRDADRMDLVESLRPLGLSDAELKLKSFKPYPQLVEHVFHQLAWDRRRFRAYRVEIEYPLYGMQIAMAYSSSTGL